MTQTDTPTDSLKPKKLRGYNATLRELTKRGEEPPEKAPPSKKLKLELPALAKLTYEDIANHEELAKTERATAAKHPNYSLVLRGDGKNLEYNPVFTKQVGIDTRISLWGRFIDGDGFHQGLRFGEGDRLNLYGVVPGEPRVRPSLTDEANGTRWLVAISQATETGDAPDIEAGQFGSFRVPQVVSDHPALTCEVMRTTDSFETDPNSVKTWGRDNAQGNIHDREIIGWEYEMLIDTSKLKLGDKIETTLTIKVPGMTQTCLDVLPFSHKTWAPKEIEVPVYFEVAKPKDTSPNASFMGGLGNLNTSTT